LNAGNLLRSYGNNLNEAIIMLSNDETMEDKKTPRTAAVLNKDIDSRTYFCFCICFLLFNFLNE
jgi:hypothetical protein